MSIECGPRNGVSGEDVTNTSFATGVCWVEDVKMGVYGVDGSIQLLLRCYERHQLDRVVQ